MIMKSKLSDRGTMFSVVFYGQQDELASACSKASNFIYMFHDMDTDWHYHVILQYSNARSCSAVQKDFLSFSNCFVELLRGLNGCLEYLTHENEKDKYHYSRTRLKSSSFH